MVGNAFDMMGRKLRDGEQVVIYGAACNILSILARLDARYHVKPGAIGDGNQKNGVKEF